MRHAGCEAALRTVQWRFLSFWLHAASVRQTVELDIAPMRAAARQKRRATRSRLASGGVRVSESQNDAVMTRFREILKEVGLVQHQEGLHLLAR